jgi:hypothetical protein
MVRGEASARQATLDRLLEVAATMLPAETIEARVLSSPYRAGVVPRGRLHLGLHPIHLGLPPRLSHGALSGLPT